MKIRTEGSTAFDGQQAVELSADAGSVESAGVEGPVELTAAETAGLNGLTFASAAHAMLSQQEPTAVSPTAIQASSLPISDVADSGADSVSLADVSDSGIVRQNESSGILNNGRDALNALVQSTAQRAATLIASSEETNSGDTAGLAVRPDSSNRGRGTARTTSQSRTPRISPQATPTEAPPGRNIPTGQRVAGSSTEMPTGVAGNGRLEPGFEPVTEVASDPTPTVAAERASAGEDLIASLADGSSAASPSPGLQDGKETQPDVLQNRSMPVDDGTNMAQLRELGLLPQEPASASSDVAFYEAQPENVNASAPRARISISADHAGGFADPQIFSGAAVDAASDNAVRSTNVSARLSKLIEKSHTENVIAGLQATSLRSSDIEEISDSLSDQIAEQASEGQRRLAQRDATASAEMAAGVLVQSNQAILEELAARQRALVAARQDSLSIIDTTQAAVDTAAAAAAQLPRQQAFSTPADVDTLASRQSGKHTGSQDENSSGKSSVNSITGGEGDGDLSILSSYRPPLFNRRLETNGVDDALILLIASLRETGSGRAVEPIFLQPVTAVSIVAPRDESPEERAADAVLPEQLEEKRRWLRTPQLQRPYFQFDSDAFERAMRDTLQQRPSMQRRRPHNPVMSDPRSTGVAERAAFWVGADMDRVGHQSARSSTISATMSHRALHPVRMQPHANCHAMS